MFKDKRVKIFYSLVAVALVVFTFTDLSISNLVYNPESIFGWFFESFGEAILGYIGAFSALYLIKTKTNGLLKNSGLGLVLILNLLTPTALISMYLKFNTLMIIIFAVFNIALIIILVNLVPNDKIEVTRKVSKVGIVISLAPIIIINVIKMLWGRQRYRSMDDPLTQFSMWFIPQGLTTNNEFMSFPSGHSANSASIIWITLLPLVFNKLKGKENLMIMIAGIWTLCVMFSRIIVGAHFASDVTMGMLITVSVFLWAKKRYIGDYYEN